MIFKTISSSFIYNRDNVIHVIKKINSIRNYKESKCDLYNMAYISQSAIHCSKGNLKCVLNYYNFPVKIQWIYFKEHWVLVLRNKRGRKSSRSQFLTQTDKTNKISAYEVDTA